MSIYPAGQCTDECATDSPWCVRYGNLGNAKDWDRNWERFGGAVSAAPVVGSIACFQPGVDGASAPYGHVGIVRAVNGQTFTIEEENGPAGPGVDDFRNCRVQAGVRFLLQGAVPAPAPVGPTAATFAVTVMAKCTAGANVRAGTNTTTAVIRSNVRPGTVLTCNAWQYGQVETDLETGKPDRRWYGLVIGGWIASALVDGNAPGSQP